MPGSRVPSRIPLVHRAGHFYFADLRTTSFDAAEGFYGPLFGWNFVDVSGNIEGQDYWIARIAERDTAGIGLSQPADFIPTPHWRPYLTVDDISAALAQAVVLGARVVEPLVRIPGDGSLVTVQDPGGALLTLWQYAAGSESITVKDDLGAPFWTELHTVDVATSRAFYGALVGWRFEERDACGEHGHVAVPAVDDPRQPVAASLVSIGDGSHHTGAGSHWRIFFNVLDPDATARRAVDLGGRVVVEPWDQPGVGRAAILADPSGATFVVMRPVAGLTG